MKKILIIISFFSILLSSCDLEKIVDIGDIPITPHLVLNGLIRTDTDTSYFYITESRSIYMDSIINRYNDKSKFKIIEDAELSLQVNGKAYHTEYSHADTAYILVGRFKEGDEIRVQSAHNGREIKSVGVLPSAPEIVSLDTVPFRRLNGYGELTDYLMFKLKIKDEPGINNYYRLLINGMYTYLNYWDSEYYYYYYNSFYTNDPVLSGGYEGNSGSTGWLPSYGYNYYSVFRDVAFAGREYTLSFYIERSSLYPQASEEDEDYIPKSYLTVRLQSISEDLYKYYSSLQYNLQIRWDNTKEPVIVHTNIAGGLGILGTCTEVEVFEYNNY